MSSSSSFSNHFPIFGAKSNVQDSVKDDAQGNVKQKGSVPSLSALRVLPLDEALKALVAQQPTVSELDLHPRNKKDKQVGKVYNAHRVLLLDPAQLSFLTSKIHLTIQEDGCWTSNALAKQSGNASVDVKSDGLSSSIDVFNAAARPRGVSLGSKQSDKRFSADTTFEQVQVMMADKKIYAPTSEHEVSHLCHNPFCLNTLHLVWELHRVNHAREKCRWTREIKCPGMECGITFNLCEHTPRCIPCHCTIKKIE
jgi:hypothetical protein